MGAKIETYLDCRYSQFSWEESMLARNRKKLTIYPPQGNTPPWINPAKAKYGQFDRQRASRYFKVTDMVPPPFFPPVTILVYPPFPPLSPPSGWIQVSSLPQRVATYLKANYPRDRFEKTFLLYWTYMFYRHIDLSKPENMMALLREEKYSDVEIETIMKGAQTPEGKKALADRTKEALDRGAFGAPWFWVTNAQGKAGPFFGSDRFHYMWQFLGIPFQDVEIIANGAKL
ncbi:DSBA family oxidoreductase [Histoplasma capsulatum var. duboisii H88]|uniref:DSBA family oxidoreductase n=1 Tax=Ajellomyces capsulatus (strain H88) TaxID=544711 RepID=F0UEG0_AJEC8|nr:DSBA family oxidoreductase [Histoplasma capsulatum var. duboisii H88]